MLFLNLLKRLAFGCCGRMWATLYLKLTDKETDVNHHLCASALQAGNVIN